ncbi:hypothetical protein AOQ71_20935 [Bradyrhizobium manausense]|uniref:Uncharacterized protein n=2 Tax=Bradyrhizobium manausense TaxID=989370 RepID=A0A0R3DHH0_9BRAD|nr:hypothetical protein AOQ71_20935 [Bradyrhizobium manausense]
MSRSEASEWFAELRHPISGELRLSPFIVAREHIPDVVRAFGPQDVAGRRRLAIEIDTWAIQLHHARIHKVPLKFASADRLFARLERATVNLQSLWAEASPFHKGLSLTNTIMFASSEARSRSSLEEVDPTVLLADMLRVIRAVRNPEMFMRMFSHQGVSSHKSVERAVLWEPLLGLMSEHHIHNFSQHQPLIATVRALHRACGVTPPDPAAVRQTTYSWRKRNR